MAVAYGTVLYLDSKELKNVPEDLLVVKQQEVAKLAKTELTDLENTAKVLSSLINNKVKGVANENQIKAGLNYQNKNFKGFEPYGFEIKDGRDIFSHSLQLHKFYTGKIGYI